jgi:exonuclease III
VLAGDYNVVTTDLDIYPTKSWDRKALLQPQSRAAYQCLLAQGWTEAVRALHPKEPDLHVLGLHAEALRTERGSPPCTGPSVSRSQYST